jgi:hypothetical protein
MWRFTAVAVVEPEDERKGYHFGSLNADIKNEPCRARTCDPLIKGNSGFTSVNISTQQLVLFLMISHFLVY